jgi:hypothetical protein
MSDDDGNESGIRRGRPFQKGKSGNPRGKPPGARHRVTLAAEALLDGQAEKLTQKAIENALEGDATALRLCLERILPVRRERPARLALPKLTSAADAPTAMAAIIDGVAAEEITLGEAAVAVKLVESFIHALETSQLEERLRRIEEWKDRHGDSA